ncbi:response regulator transcription factor [Vallitalea maricola]|uniref:Two-component system response regulator YxJL n=1 Tax=Vallitalea maricola TaxID=3074433 RepID=A0ACB5UGE9_9FIRM|nr:two-component system response regulator YxJL [Vallitalea sp. AN17-2]
MTNDMIKVMIADDMIAHRRRLERIIAKQSDMELVASAENGYEAVMFAGMYKPDIILMDIEMENQMAGITAAKQINDTLSAIKIIMLTVCDRSEIVVAAFQTGIVDYILKTAEPEEIIDAIRSAHKNLSPIRPIIAEKIRKEFRESKIKEQSLLYVLKLISELTSSELEVLKLLCDGMTRKQIAQLRFVEVGTIKKQINSILKKCEQNRTKDLIYIIKELRIFDILKKL